MTQANEERIASLEQELIAIEKTEFPVQHNCGTFSAEEAQRAVGTGQPEFSEYTIYETVLGSRRIQGCDPKKAPGYARGSRDSLLAAQRRRAEIQREIRSLSLSR